MNVAIFSYGSRQYCVTPRAVIELLDAAPQDVGAKIRFDSVLLISIGADIRIGSPTVPGAHVEGEIVSVTKRRMLIGRFKRKTRFHHKLGHIQRRAKVRITAIQMSS